MHDLKHAPAPFAAGIGQLERQSCLADTGGTMKQEDPSRAGLVKPRRQHRELLGPTLEWNNAIPRFQQLAD
jgi:hypothetical protein